MKGEQGKLQVMKLKELSKTKQIQLPREVILKLGS